jgi:hypothetical protein
MLVDELGDRPRFYSRAESLRHSNPLFPHRAYRPPINRWYSMR